MDEPKFWVKMVEGQPTEVGYGPKWVAMAMYIDDYPKFYTREDAKNYWEKTLKKEQK